jgi:ferredoxin-NADP reductase
MDLLFREKHHETATIWTFVFEPQEPLSWVAGQSIRLEIPGPYGTIEHRFSISSAPSTRHIAITTRLSGSDYKDSLDALQPGDIVQGFHIKGECIWYEHAQPHIFVAAGIGLVPFNAMIVERIAHNQSVPATFLCSGRDEPALFKHGLENIAAAHSELSVSFQQQRIHTQQILSLPDAAHRTIYISGPSKMVDALSADLIAAGIPPAHIIRDLFTGRLALDG